jgi:transcriptional antiterminator NusG
MNQEPTLDFDFQINDLVKIIEGPLKDFEGKVIDIDQEKGKLKILVNIFNRETPVEINFYQVKKI